MFRALVTREGMADEFHIDSCGTLDYHTGQAPDRRAQATAVGRGIDISGLKARQYQANDFTEFEYIIAMDRDNMIELLRECPDEHHHKLRLFCSYAPNRSEDEVPDPYYGGAKGFESVYDLIQEASDGLLAAIQDSAAG